MKEEDVKKTTFVCQEGLFEFLCMPISLQNASATLQWALDLLMASLTWEWVLIYLDDLVVFAPSLRSFWNIWRLFGCLVGTTLKLKPSICFFRYSSVKCLGHIISAEGIHPDPEKVAAI